MFEGCIGAVLTIHVRDKRERSSSVYVETSIIGNIMWRDPIVERVRELREQYAARFNHDLKAICRDLRERQKAGGLGNCHSSVVIGYLCPSFLDEREGP